MNDDLTILKLFFLLRQTINYDDMFTKLSFSHKTLIKNKEICVFPHGVNEYHILAKAESVIVIEGKEDLLVGITNVSYHKRKAFSSSTINKIYEEIYAAAVEHNFLHEVGKFH